MYVLGVYRTIFVNCLGLQEFHIKLEIGWIEMVIEITKRNIVSTHLWYTFYSTQTMKYKIHSTKLWINHAVSLFIAQGKQQLCGSK